MPRRGLAMARATFIFVSLALLARPALAGPPYISDDPEPTDYGHFEIYGFTTGTATRDNTTGQAGIDFNYGALPDLQVTVVLPMGFVQPADGTGQVRLSNSSIYNNQTGFGCGGGTLASAGNNRKAGNTGGVVPVCAPTVAVTLQ